MQSNVENRKIHLLLRIQSEIDEAGKLHSGESDPTSAIQWKSLESHLKRRQISATDDIPVLLEFVKSWGGGVGGNFIADLHRLHALPKTLAFGRGSSQGIDKGKNTHCSLGILIYTLAATAAKV